MANGSQLHSLPCMVQMAAAFALGASGVVLGTRLCATHESLLPEAKKQALLEAGYSSSCNPSTLRTTLYDELGTVPWPPHIEVDVSQTSSQQWPDTFAGRLSACKFIWSAYMR